MVCGSSWKTASSTATSLVTRAFSYLSNSAVTSATTSGRSISMLYSLDYVLLRRWPHRRDHAFGFERVRDAQRHVLAPRRRDDLHGDRQRRQRHRHGDHRQADEGNRLGVDAEIGAHRHFGVAEPEGFLTDQRRDARRRRRQNGVDLGKQFQHFGAIPAAEFLRLDNQRRRRHGAGDQPVAYGGIVI